MTVTSAQAFADQFDGQIFITGLTHFQVAALRLKSLNLETVQADVFGTQIRQRGGDDEHQSPGRRSVKPQCSQSVAVPLADHRTPPIAVEAIGLPQNDRANTAGGV